MAGHRGRAGAVRGRHGRDALAVAPVLDYGIYPYPISHGDLKAMHGNDERVPIRGGLEQGTDMLTRVLRAAIG